MLKQINKSTEEDTEENQKDKKVTWANPLVKYSPQPRQQPRQQPIMKKGIQEEDIYDIIIYIKYYDPVLLYKIFIFESKFYYEEDLHIHITLEELKNVYRNSGQSRNPNKLNPRAHEETYIKNVIIPVIESLKNGDYKDIYNRLTPFNIERSVYSYNTKLMNNLTQKIKKMQTCNLDDIKKYIEDTKKEIRRTRFYENIENYNPLNLDLSSGDREPCNLVEIFNIMANRLISYVTNVFLPSYTFPKDPEKIFNGIKKEISKESPYSQAEYSKEMLLLFEILGNTFNVIGYNMDFLRDSLQHTLQHSNVHQDIKNLIYRNLGGFDKQLVLIINNFVNQKNSNKRI